MRVLIVAPELAPLATAGGLGDVIGSLPQALAALGCRVSVALPAYRRAMERVETFETAESNLPITLGNMHLTVDIISGELAGGISLYMVRRDEFFDRQGIYGNSDGEYFDNLERYIFFSRSIPVLCSALGLRPNVILANDWQTGLVMALIDQGALPGTSGVFVIHNMGYLGLVPPERAGNIGLPSQYYRMDGLEFHGQMSLLKAGIVYAKEIVTVSPTYSEEIQAQEFGFGLDGLMRSVRGRLHGILNGVDYQVWNPAKDRHIASGYSKEDITGKSACKQDLLGEMGLPPDLLDRPVAGMVSRLVGQKGCNLLIEAAEELFSLGMGLVVLGSGDAMYEDLFRSLKADHPDRFGLKLGFDPVLAHKIVAGSDIFLIPSLYEPCGLTQMYCLRYGTIPIVRSTGGLKDTVIDPADGKGQGTGFRFDRAEAADLVDAVKRALDAFYEIEVWEKMMKEGMSRDFSWRRSAKKYLNLFERVAGRGL